FSQPPLGQPPLRKPPQPPPQPPLGQPPLAKGPRGVLRNPPSGALRKTPSGVLRNPPSGALRKEPNGVLRNAPLRKATGLPSPASGGKPPLAASWSARCWMSSAGASAFSGWLSSAFAVDEVALATTTAPAVCARAERILLRNCLRLESLMVDLMWRK